MGILGTIKLTKGTLSLYAPKVKSKSHGSSPNSFRGNPTTHKKKLGSLYSLPNDFVERGLNSVANEKVSHLAVFMHYVTKNNILNVVVERNGLVLSKFYSQALKAC